MAGRGAATTKGEGGTKVKLTIKAKVKDPKDKNDPMIKLNNLVMINCDVEWTWNDFFKETCGVTLDPERYVVKSIGKDAVLLDQKVRDLIAKFKKIRGFYRADVVETKNRSTNAPGPGTPVTGTGKPRGRPSKASASPPKANKGPNQRKNDIKHETSSVRSMSSSASTATAPIISHANIRIQPNSTRKPATPGPKRQSNNTRKEHLSSPRRPRFEEEEGLPGTSARDPSLGDMPGANSGSRGFGGLPQHFDDDDNASQFTTASQESQDDLVNEGINIEDLKPKVVQRLMTNISNPEILRVRHELKKIMEAGKWSRFSSKAPRTANLLTELFRFTA